MKKDYPAGLIGLSTGGVECNPLNLTNYDWVVYNETPNSYDLLATQPDLNPPPSSILIAKITYHRYGNLLATLNYE